MRSAQVLSLALTLGSTVLLAAPGGHAPATIHANPNTTAAGTLRDGVLSLSLDAVDAAWHTDGGPLDIAAVPAFAERGKEPLIPGPLVRVPVGTLVRAQVRNTLPYRITFFLPRSASSDDSVAIAPGDSASLETRTTAAGNFIYRATRATAGSARMRIAGALAGAVVVDSAGAPAKPNDRVMMILMVPDTALLVAGEKENIIVSGAGTFAFTINGRAWPTTERLSATVGDSLHWRVLNASADVHPMHLHGFYFRVDQYQAPVAVGDGQDKPGRMAVTERMQNFSTMTITWSPERAGNWLFHCHFAGHLEPPGEHHLDLQANHALTGMVGLVMGIDVAPRRGEREVADGRPARRLRLVAMAESSYAPRRPSMRFAVDEGGGRMKTAPEGFSPTLYLTRGEPVAITVVNRMQEPTSVHWHGMELASYFDGVSGWSGIGSRTAPMIAPGDSFVARFTPPRSGTFMYHSHVNDHVQQRAGLVGAMIVQDGTAAPKEDEYEVFLKGALRPGGSSLEIGGLQAGDTIVMRAGRAARLRIMSLASINPNANVWLTARADSMERNAPDSLAQRWTPVAKDGADFPPDFRVPRLARQVISMGETYDFEYTPARAGLLRVEVRAGSGPNAVLLARVPIKVQ